MPLRLLPVLLPVLLALAPQASAQALKPYKDNLFAYPGILSSESKGGYLVVDYNEARDIDSRDQVPERLMVLGKVRNVPVHTSQPAFGRCRRTSR